jgi:hypothetical protein
MNCHETVTVNAKAVNWLKEKYPELCIKAGLCERVAGRLYTKTLTTSPAQPAAPVQEPKQMNGKQPPASWNTPAAPVQEPVIDHSCKDTYELIMKWADIYAAQTGNLYAQAAQDPSKVARMADERTMLACVVAQAISQPPEPDLLSALKRILDEPNNTMSDGKALKEIIRIARAAIAKATGEQA